MTVWIVLRAVPGSIIKSYIGVFPTKKEAKEYIKTTFSKITKDFEIFPDTLGAPNYI